MRLYEKWAMGAICAFMSLVQIASAQLTSTTTTRGDGKTLVKFTGGSGTWTVPNGVTEVEVLVVGGGGGTSGYTSGAGAGGMYYSAMYPVSSGNSLNISVGNGGSGSNSGGASGGVSRFGQILAYGGQGMNGYRPTADPGGVVHGGNQGGYSTDNGNTIVAGNPGGQAAWNGAFDSGGGAGAPGTHGNSAAGGAGLICAITGEYFAGGGGALENGPGGVGGGGKGGNPAQNGAANTGGGAGGGWGQDPDGASGGSGVVIVAYTSTVPTYTVSFQSNGGSPVPSQVVASGNTATEPSTPTWVGHTFAGWYSNLELTTAFDWATTITGDTTLYAKWSISSYTLTYSAGANGTLTGLSPQTVAYGDSGTAVTAVPDAGYIFASWSDGLIGNPRTDANVQGNITVTANFVVTPAPIVPTLRVRGDGRTVATFSAGDGVWTVPAGVSDLEVLVVGGGGGNGKWTSGAGAGGMYYTSSYPVSAGNLIRIQVGQGGSVPQPQPENAVATGGRSAFGSLIAYGGTGGPGYQNGGDQGGYSLDGGATVVPGVIAFHNPNPSGGFFCSGSGAGGPGVGPGNSAGGAGLPCSITGTAVYYAGGGGGNENGPGGIGGGGHGSYAFNGPADSGTANTGGGGGGSWGGAGGIGGSGVVIVAYRATLPNYTVSFESNGGSAVSSQTVQSGSAATEPTTPIRNGYTFVKWCSDNPPTTAFDFSTPITADITLYAEWTITTYTLTYNAGANGSISGSTPQAVQHGASGDAVTAVANAGYFFAGWSDGSMANPRIDSNVSGNITVTANFAAPLLPAFSNRGDGYTVATFSAGNGMWTVPPRVTSVEVLVVGGGGSGQNWNYQNQWGAGELAWGGGGGGGGFYYNSAYAVTPGANVLITVGAGGVPSNTGNPGGSSGFGTLIAYGGGIGTYGGAAGQSGGNNQGGTGFSGGAKMGGGGGAGQAGQGPWYAAPNNNGGNGVQCAISGSSIYYAGGGASYYNESRGGLGGGGSTVDVGENIPVPDPNGVNGLGGGGAGGRSALSEVGAGGSGIVIVAYQNSPPVGPDISMGATLGVPVTLQIIGGKYPVTDPDGDAVVVSAVETGLTHGTASTDGTSITYTATGTAPSVNTFYYILSDGRGGTCTRTVTVNVSAPDEGFNRVSGPIDNHNGTMTIKFMGRPGWAYALETTANLLTPNWTTIETKTVDSGGNLSFTFEATAGQGYFRTRYVPAQ